MKTISILGCGWFGLPLAKKLVENKFIVKGSTTSTEKLVILREAGVVPHLIDFSVGNEIYDTQFFNCDILFVAIPPKRKSGESHFYSKKIESICTLAAEQGIKQLILVSSTGVYPNIGKEFNETDMPQPDTLWNKALLEAEKIAKKQKSFTTTILRFGGLFGPGRNPGRFFADKRAIPNGLAPVNMIHLTDCIGISMAILQNQAFGQIYNACSAEHPTRSEFYTSAAKKTGLKPPGFIPELLEWKIVNSKNIPHYLNYKFKETLL